VTAFYSPDASQMKQEIQRVALVFVGVAVVTIPIYLLQHYFYTLMGERLTTRIRLKMFSGSYLFTIQLQISKLGMFMTQDNIYKHVQNIIIHSN
jgi:hypothetical protein